MPWWIWLHFHVWTAERTYRYSHMHLCTHTLGLQKALASIYLFIRNPCGCMYLKLLQYYCTALVAVRITGMGDGGNKNKTGCVSCKVTVKSCVLQQRFKSGVVMNVSARSILFTFTISFCTRWQAGVDCYKMELCHKSLWEKSLCKHPHSRNVQLWTAGWLDRQHKPLQRGERGGGENSLVCKCNITC